MTEIPYERLELSARRVVSKAQLEAIPYGQLNTFWNELTGTMQVELQQFLAGCPRREHHRERVPADWWQAFRERWFPAWWLRRYPLRTRTIIVRTTVWERICPHTQTDASKRHTMFLADVPEPPIEPHVAQFDWLCGCGNRNPEGIMRCVFCQANKVRRDW